MHDPTVSDPIMPYTKSAEFPLSPIDILVPRIHFTNLLYFASTAEPAIVTANLLAALRLTLQSMPIIAGSVALSRQEGQQKGSLSVQSPFFEAEDILSTKDLRDEYDYEQLRAAHFPPDSIALDVVAPTSHGKAADSAPVMIAQANFLRGGLLLFFGFHHCVLDGWGASNVARVWSSYCRGVVGLDFVTPQWFNRNPLMEGVGTGRLEDHPEYPLAPEGATARATEDSSVFQPISEIVQSATFFFSDEALERLKMAATMPGLDKWDEGTAWISTNDALVALFWCCITSARLAGSAKATDEIFPLFAMALNGRSRLHPRISPDYCGNVVLVAKTLSKADDLLSSQLGCLAKAASLIRKAVNVVDDAYIRDVIQMVRNVDDIGRLASRRRPAVEYSLGCSSWAGQPFYSHDWGNTVGGACERVRGRPVRTDGYFMIYPRLPGAEDLNGGKGEKQGGIEVQLGLQGVHMQRLMKDPVFMEFAQWRSS